MTLCKFLYLFQIAKWNHCIYEGFLSFLKKQKKQILKGIFFSQNVKEQKDTSYTGWLALFWQVLKLTYISLKKVKKLEFPRHLQSIFPSEINSVFSYRGEWDKENLRKKEKTGKIVSFRTHRMFKQILVHCRRIFCVLQRTISLCVTQCESGLSFVYMANRGTLSMDSPSSPFSSPDSPQSNPLNESPTS